MGLPKEQMPPAGTLTPHAPQLLRSTVRETQEPPQFVRPLAQQTPLSLWKPGVHCGTPPRQTPPTGARTPHAPQLLRSTSKSTQRSGFEQKSSAGDWHTASPPMQIASTGMWVPQDPQLSGSE